MKTKIKLVGFNSADKTVVEKISRNLAALFATPEGTCAGDRSYGISWDFVDLPAPQASNLLAVEAAEKIAKYEPRADLAEAECTVDSQGIMTATIIVTANPDYAADDEGETNG